MASQTCNEHAMGEAEQFSWMPEGNLSSPKCSDRSIQPLIKWTAQVPSPGIKRPVSEADHSFPSNADGDTHPQPHRRSWCEGNCSFKGKGNCSFKVKAVPLQVWSGPEGSRKLRFPDFMITAQDGGKVVSLTHRPLLPPGNAPLTHFC